MTLESRITRLPRPFDPEKGEETLSSAPWSSGAVAEKARSAVIGSTQTTVSNMARLLPAITL